LHLEQVQLNKFSQLDLGALLLSQLAVKLINKPLNLLLEPFWAKAVMAAFIIRSRLSSVFRTRAILTLPLLDCFLWAMSIPIII
jgi:hypothetical protein